MNAHLGLVADVISFSSVDGPGNRFVVFLQGCNFDCVACHNPYTIGTCTHCGECVGPCPSGALALDPTSLRVVWDETTCTGSDTCITVCPEDSTPKAHWRSVDDLIGPIRRAAPFLSGVTASGGEATQQAPFLAELFAAIKDDESLGRLTTMVDTNGSAPRATWDRLLPVMDGALVDLKALDADLHRRMTGQPNGAVLDSIHYLAGHGKLHEIRLLLIPGLNDGTAMLCRTADWLRAVDPGMRLRLIGFRPHGVRPIARDLPEPTTDQMRAYCDIFADAGFADITCV